MRFRGLPAVVAMTGLLLVSSCAGQPPPATAPTPQPTRVTIPDTPVGEQIGWVLDQLAADSGPEPAEAEARFAEAFLSQVPADQVADVFDELRGLGPWRLTGITGDTHQSEVALRDRVDDPWLMTIAVDSDQRVQTLAFAPDPVADRTPATSLDEVTAELAGLADHAGFLAARVVDGQCVPVVERESEEQLPLGSVFKLYVLGALAGALDDGTATWEETVTVTDALRSLPTGRLQDEPEGTEVPLREAAELMISISDNTATDLIIDRLGRDRVEAVLAQMRHSEPERNLPFLTTRELFLLGWGAPERREQWAGADPAGRAAMLPDLAAASLDEVDPASMTTPGWPDDIEWFASPADVCAAHIALQERAGGVPAVRDILAVNPGIAVDTATWPYVGFKGGGSPGVLAGSWYAERAGGEAMVVVFQLASASGPVDQRHAFAVAADVFALLAEAGG